MPKAKLPFVGPAYRARSIRADAQRCVNLFLERDETTGQMALYGTPGLVRQWVFPNGPVRGVEQMQGDAYWVAGADVWRVQPDGTQTMLGVIGTTTGFVGIATNGLQVLIVDGESGWIATESTLTEIADPDFPAGVTSAAYQDSYFIVAGNGSGQFFLSDNLDGGAWNSLDTASAEGDPDELLAVISDHRELWLMGSRTVEPWQDTGNSSFPYQRVGNTVVEKGLAARHAVCKADNTIFWLGQGEQGGYSMWRANGYTPERISTHAVEYSIAAFTAVDDANAWAYEQEGHLFVVFVFPSGNTTWVYDVATGSWHERRYRNSEDNALQAWRPQVHLFWQGRHYVGDRADGRVYTLDLDIHTDDGDPLVSIRACAAQDSSQMEVFWQAFQLDAEFGVGSELGSDPLVSLRWSNDGGYTWSGYHTRSLGKEGEYEKRAIWRRLGRGRNRVFEVSISDDCRRVIKGAIAQFEAGAF